MVVAAAYELDEVPVGYPHIVQSPSVKAVEFGRPALMNCEAVGDPEPVISWLKNSVPVDTFDQRLQILPSGALLINETRESDEGIYECVAENSAGTTYSYGASLYVRVPPAPPEVMVIPDRAKVRPGGSVNLTCLAGGSPFPWIRWRRGADWLTPEEEAVQGRSTLVLTDLRQTTIYTCSAENEFGHMEHRTKVRVIGAPMRV